MEYFESVDLGNAAIKPLITAMHAFYSPRNLRFGLGKAGQGYASFHVVLNGITYGRITFYQGRLYTIKYYKQDDYAFDVNDPGEILFLQIKAFFRKGRLLGLDEIQNTIQVAEECNKQELAQRQAYREAHPGRRKALKGRNIRHLINRVLFEGYHYQVA